MPSSDAAHVGDHMDTETDASDGKTFQYYLDRYVQELQKSIDIDRTRHKMMLLKTASAFPETFTRKPMKKISFDEVLQLLDSMHRRHEYEMHLCCTILRYCYKTAYVEREISVNFMDYIHLRDIMASRGNITDEHYESIKKAIYTVPGGKAYGLAAFLNTSFKNIGELHYEDYHADSHVIQYIDRSTLRIDTLFDPDAIELLEHALNEYRDKMSDPVVAEHNSQHYLFTTKIGTPYSHHQFFWIGQMVREKSGIIDLDIKSLKKYLQTRNL